MSSNAAAHRPLMHCDQAESVFQAIEQQWKDHHRDGVALSLYPYLAQVLNTKGLLVDTLDGLQILEHCRRRNLPIIDILYSLEDRVRSAGYRGGSLSVADYAVEHQPVFVFYDSRRFASFEALKAHVAALAGSAEGSGAAHTD